MRFLSLAGAAAAESASCAGGRGPCGGLSGTALGGHVTFDRHEFVAACRKAATAADAPAAVSEVVAAGIVAGPSIDATLGTVPVTGPDPGGSDMQVVLEPSRWFCCPEHALEWQPPEP